MEIKNTKFSLLFINPHSFFVNQPLNVYKKTAQIWVELKITQNPH